MSGGAPTVGVIGAGFSGLLTAIHLLRRRRDLVVRLVEKAGRFGPGRAYAGGNPGHLLNVRAANMSAFPDDPGHFQAWLRTRGESEDGFVSRGRYGEYLQALLRQATGPGGYPGRLLLEQDEAVAIETGGGRSVVRLAMGRRIAVDAVVLAVGLGAPSGAREADWRAHIADPWRIDPTSLPAGDILLVGSGLTMVDVVLGLDRPDRRFTVLSRRGLTPRRHGPAAAAPPPSGAMDTPLGALRTLRAHADAVGWRSAVDSVRPLTAGVWRDWTPAQRGRFLRHARPWWDIHRHRMAPQVAARIDSIVGAGRLRVVAGRVEDVRATGEALDVTFRRRRATLSETRTFAAAIRCTGLSGDLSRLPVVSRLVAAGAARPDELDLGLDVDAAFRVLGRAGAPTPGLYAVGPITRAARWETVAVPDLRGQTWELAGTVLADLAASWTPPVRMATPRMVEFARLNSGG